MMKEIVIFAMWGEKKNFRPPAKPRTEIFPPKIAFHFEGRIEEKRKKKNKKKNLHKLSGLFFLFLSFLNFSRKIRIIPKIK
jgi:hypothetical protein